MGECLREYLRFLAERPFRNVASALIPFAFAAALARLTVAVLRREGAWLEWAEEASHWFYYESMGYLAILCLMCVPAMIEDRRRGVLGRKSALLALAFVSPPLVLGMVGSWEGFRSFRPFALFVFLTLARCVQFYLDNAKANLAACEKERLMDGLLWSSAPFPASAIVAFCLGVPVFLNMHALSDDAIAFALGPGDVDMIYAARSLLCGVIYYALFPFTASVTTFLAETPSPPSTSSFVR